MVATEDILFIMPKDRELQFPAMAALQSYVNNYQMKMESNCVTTVMPEYRFRYQTTMSPEDWELFAKLGIALVQQPEQISFPDSVIEMSDAKILSFYNSEKHAAQVCAALSGVEAPPYPKVKQPTPGLASGVLCITDYPVPHTLLEKVLQWRGEYSVQLMISEDWTRLLDTTTDAAPTPVYVGTQSWQTYALSAMNLPVIEILPKGRGLNWLSKWKNSLYRLVEEDQLARVPDALRNIEATLKFLEEKRCRSGQDQAAKEAIATPTEATASSARAAASISATPRFGLERSHAPSVRQP